MSKKIKYSKFESENGDIVDCIKINSGCLNICESFDDIELYLNIVDGDVKISVIDQHLYTKDELDDIEHMLKLVNFDDCYEFIDFIDIYSDETYYLIGDNNSDMVNMINSKQNMNNINNV